jgi:hypothetical protein
MATTWPPTRPAVGVVAPPTELVSATASDLSSLAVHGGPTDTLVPLTGNLAIAYIPNPSTPSSMTLADGSSYSLCPLAAYGPAAASGL